MHSSNSEHDVGENIYDKLYQIYKAALVEEYSICPIVILGFITNCFGSASQVYGPNHLPDVELLIQQIQVNGEFSWFFNVADAMFDCTRQEGCALD